jgi:lipopolysaccharide biosynthesis regulator YciM
VQRNRAVLAVGEDFFKSGMYDRAEDFLKRVGGGEYAPHALRLLIDLYVNQNEWHRCCRCGEPVAIGYWSIQ